MVTAGGVLGGLGSIYEGYSTFKESNILAEDLRIEGEIIYQEAIRSASMIQEEGRKFAAAQSLQYIGSGVQLAGSALVTLAQTKKYAETEAKAIKQQGSRSRDLAERNARTKEQEGRASLVSGIVGGISSIFL